MFKDLYKISIYKLVIPSKSRLATMRSVLLSMLSILYDLCWDFVDPWTLDCLFIPIGDLVQYLKPFNCAQTNELNPFLKCYLQTIHLKSKNEITDKLIFHISCIFIWMCANKWLMLNCCWYIAVFKTVWLCANRWLKGNRMICIRWRYLKSFDWRKMSSSLLKNISKMFTHHMCLLTNPVYNYLTMCKQIADVGLNYWCCVAVMLGAICLCDNWIFWRYKINFKPN